MTDGLRRGALLEICLGEYRRHHDNGSGRCVACLEPLSRCATRRNCEKVLLAAGLDPARFGRTVSFAW